MAIINADNLALFRRLLASETEEVTWQKADVNVAVQALEDWWETTGRAAAGSVMEAASAGKFSNAQKKAIGKFWLNHKFNGGG